MSREPHDDAFDYLHFLNGQESSIHVPASSELLNDVKRSINRVKERRNHHIEQAIDNLNEATTLNKGLQTELDDALNDNIHLTSFDHSFDIRSSVNKQKANFLGGGI